MVEFFTEIYAEFTMALCEYHSSLPSQESPNEVCVNWPVTQRTHVTLTVVVIQGDFI